MQITTNDIGGFIMSCQQAAYLQQIRAVIDQRLADLGSPGSVCAVCSGRRVVMKNIGSGMTEEPCPSCSPKKAPDPKVAADYEERLNGLQEAILKKNAEIDGLKAALSEALKNVTSASDPGEVTAGVQSELAASPEAKADSGPAVMTTGAGV